MPICEWQWDVKRCRLLVGYSDTRFMDHADRYFALGAASHTQEAHALLLPSVALSCSNREGLDRGSRTLVDPSQAMRPLSSPDPRPAPLPRPIFRQLTNSYGSQIYTWILGVAASDPPLPVLTRSPLDIKWQSCTFITTVCTIPLLGRPLLVST